MTNRPIRATSGAGAGRGPGWVSAAPAGSATTVDSATYFVPQAGHRTRCRSWDGSTALTWEQAGLGQRVWTDMGRVLGPGGKSSDEIHLCGRGGKASPGGSRRPARLI